MKKVLVICISSILIITLVLGLMFFQIKPKNILILGDSIASGYGVNQNEAYGYLLSEFYNYNYQNLAKAGDTTSDLIEKLNKTDFESGVKESDIICISIGGNDFLSKYQELINLFNNNQELEILNLVKKILNQMSINLDKIIKRINEINPNSQIIIQTIYTNPLKEYTQNSKMLMNLVNSTFFEYNQKNENSFLIADVNQVFEAQTSNIIQSDKIHPNKSGHQLIFETISQIIKNNGYKKALMKY